MGCGAAERWRCQRGVTVIAGKGNADHERQARVGSSGYHTTNDCIDGGRAIAARATPVFEVEQGNVFQLEHLVLDEADWYTASAMLDQLQSTHEHPVIAWNNR